MGKDLKLERLVTETAALGVSGLILVMAVSSTGLVGAVAAAAGLAMLVPGGMIGGMAAMGLALLISNGIAEYGLEAILEAVIKELLSEGHSKQSIKNEISKCWIATGMKHRLYVAVDRNQRKGNTM